MDNKIYCGLSFNNHSKPSLSVNYWNGPVNIVPSDYETQYLELYEKFKNNKLKNNTSVYLTKMANLPSYKLKNYIEENKLNVNLTRVYSKLNAIIIDDNFIKESYFNGKQHNYYLINVDYIKSKFKKYIISNNFQEHTHNKKIDAFLVREEQIKEWAKTDPNFLKLLDFPYMHGRELIHGHGYKKVQDNYEAFCKLKETIEKYNLEIIFDHNINEEINKDLVVDTDMFQNILNMLTSTDKGNIEIAKEIIANCSLEESKPYLIYLLNLFPILRTVNNNKNYDFIRKKLIKEIVAPWVGRYPLPSTDSFIPKLINKNPKFTPQYMDCFRIHLNYLIKKDIIKEIVII